MKKSIKNMFVAVLVMALTITSLITTDATTVQAASGKVTSVSVTNLPAKTLTLKKGKSKVLKVKVAVSKKSVSTAYTFKSSNEKVVTVKKSGKNIKLTAKKKGTAKITITSKANKKKKVTINVTVGTPVTKVAISSKTANITVGSKKTLKATVSPKKPSNKKVVWTSSNKKVATVSSKGVVKAVKAGTAKITATAADGSGKKATCKVTVSNPVGLSAVNVYNSKVLQVSLSGAKALNASNFKIMVKALDDGTFNRTLGIESVTTSNKKDYTIVLDSDSSIGLDCTVQVTVAALTGTKTLAKKYVKPVATYTGDNVMTMTYNQNFSADIYIGGSGYLALTSVSGLPGGITAKANGDYVEFSGKPTVKGTFTAQLSVKDERGNVYKKTIYMLVGAADKIAAAVTPVYTVIGTNGTYIDRAIYVTGGSGSYKYEIVGNAYGLSMSGRYLEGNLKAAGTYKINVKVTDTNNANLSATTTVVINAKQGITITGFVKDLSGAAIADNAYVYFDNVDDTDRYLDGDGAWVYSNGIYVVTIVPGTYDVSVTAGNSTNYLINQKYTATKSGADLQAGVYKVSVTSNDPAVTSFETWYDAKGESVGYGNTLYLKPGAYALTSSGSIFLGTYKATLNVNVTKATAAVAAATKTIDNVATATENVPVYSGSGEMDASSYFKFVPSQTGTYYFYAENCSYAYVNIYNASGSNLDRFSFTSTAGTFTFEKGVTYYLYFSVENDNDDNYSCGVYTTNPAEVN